MLHLIFQSPIDNTVLERMACGDVAVFLDSAVLGVLLHGKMAQTLTDKLTNNRLYVLSEDMAVRGILETELVAGLETIDYPGLVKLSIENPFNPIMVLKVNGLVLKTTEQGFLANSQDWDEAVAHQLAQQENIALTEEHWEIILFIRSYYQQFRHLPNTRMFIKVIARTLGETKGNSRYLHRLFPDGPLKVACKLAGLPKPPTCL